MTNTRKAGSAGRRVRRAFSPEFKGEAVRLVAERRELGSVAQVGRELDVRPDLLRIWVREQAVVAKTGVAVPGETPDQVLRRLRRENAVLRQEQAIAKKCGGVLREGVALRYAVITRHRRGSPLRLMCRVLEVAPSGYSAWRTRSPSLHALADELLMARVRCVYQASGETYGAPRIHEELKAEGSATSRKRIARHMLRDGLPARVPARRRVGTTDSQHAEPIAPHLLARQFEVNGVAPDQVWVSDISVPQEAA